MTYYAHSANNEGKWHELAEHLIQTAQVAELFACDESYKRIFNIAGILHDLGKYQLEFQEYLTNGGRRGSVPHSSWGAGFARIQKMLEVSIAIDGHHKGLPDNAVWKHDTDPFVKGEIANFNRIVDLCINEINWQKRDTKPVIFKEPYHRELFIRYLFSVLTDADWLSTEKHFQRNIYEIRMHKVLDYDGMIKKLNKAYAMKPKDGLINQLRNEVRSQILEKTELSMGFYSLTLPTGLGKTLTSVSWALQHAKKHKLKRIIIVLPYVNIIDQTAQVLKSIFGDEVVLEHHAGVFEMGQDDINEEWSELEKRKRLACENWDYSIIVTTTVQFFESLFSNRPSKCRKIHNVAESVVVFDEVQSLPKDVILPTLQMLQDMQTIMKVSYLFCTATQPAFEKRQKFDGITSITPLLDDPSALYVKTQRVEYCCINNLEPIDSEALLKAVRENKTSALVIFNTKKTALSFFDDARNDSSWEMKYHLSTAMCPEHRKQTINAVRSDLDKKRKILLVSTQLIEAGVDFDFPCVFRAMAPLEAVIQSAGRCNREGKMIDLGKVYLFKVNDAGMPDQTYAACAGHAETFINRLHDYKVFNEYYAQIINLYVDPDKYHINSLRKQFDFEAVNHNYRIIRNVTESLYVYNYSEESRQLLHSIENKEVLSREDFRKLQKYTVQVYRSFLFQNNLIIKSMPQGFLVWYGSYDCQTGISVLPIEADKLVL